MSLPRTLSAVALAAALVSAQASCERPDTRTFESFVMGTAAGVTVACASEAEAQQCAH